MNEVEKNNWERILAYIKTEHYINKLYDRERDLLIDLLLDKREELIKK